MLNPQRKQSIEQHVANIEQITKAKLSHILLNTYTKQNHNLYGHTVKTFGISSSCDNRIEDIKPFTIGQFALCFMSMPGPSPDNSIICITHVSEQSTKLPVIFPANMIGVWYVKKLT